MGNESKEIATHLLLFSFHLSTVDFYPMNAWMCQVFATSSQVQIVVMPCTMSFPEVEMFQTWVDGDIQLENMDATL